VKEYVQGSAHEVTERLFVVRRAFRVNDSLPDESAIRWQGQRGGWMLVDRMTGRISAINSPPTRLPAGTATMPHTVESPMMGSGLWLWSRRSGGERRY
jgi:hypothetical protein